MKATESRSRVAVIVGLILGTIGLLGAMPRVAGTVQRDDQAAVHEVLLSSASSFEKNDVATAEKVWVNDESLTVFESGHANYGWTDYRNNHLVPEMAEMKNTKYSFSAI